MRVLGLSLVYLLAHAASLRLLERPAMRLYGIISARDGWGPDKSTTWTADDVKVASMFEMVYPQFSETTAAMLKGNTVRIKYKNYGGSAPSEAPTVEIDHHADIAYYRVGLLSRALDTADTTVHVRRAPHSPGQVQDPWDPNHPGGLKASTAAGNASVVNNRGNVQSYITWLRIGDEYMKILDVRPSLAAEPEAVVKVVRGLWGSVIGSHAINGTTLAPVYHAKGAYPGGGSNLRYAFDPSRAYTAQYVAAAYQPGIYDGLWMDCFGSQPFRASNSYGDNIGRFLYDVAGDSRYGRAGYVAAQRLLVSRVRSLTMAQGATHLYANNVDNWDNAPVLLAPGKLLDGGAKEGFICGTTGGCGFNGSYVVFDETTWLKNAAEVMNVSAASLPIMPIIGSAGCQSPQLVAMPTRDAIEDFAYASFLLAAGTRTALYGIVPYYFRDPAAGTSGGLRMGLHPRYLYPIGAPTHHAATVEDYRVARCTFARRFETALVLVNPTSNCSDAAIHLNGTWYDPTAGSAAKPLASVAVAPQQGLVLLSAPLES